MAFEDFWKWTSLLLFCLQNSLNPVVFRYATTEASASQRASTSAILFTTEFLKLLFSFCLLLGENGFSIGQSISVIHDDAIKKRRESLRLGVPAIIYALQNALLQWSSGNLPAALWQVTYQGKILVTATFSVVLLRKQIKKVQWLAITIMGLGIATVQLADANESSQASMANAAEQSVAKGFVMLLLACCCSGFASVYTEMVFKQVGSGASEKKISVWLQNMQLAVFSMLITLWSFAMEVMFPINEGATVQDSTQSQFSFFKGFTPMTWALAINNAVGGLLVALVIKYADNILRGFASSLATINCALISVFSFGFALKPSFGVGTVMVVGSTLLYGNVLKLPGDWWYDECELCAARRTYDALPTQSSDVHKESGALDNVASTESPNPQDVELSTTVGHSETKA